MYTRKLRSSKKSANKENISPIKVSPNKKNQNRTTKSKNLKITQKNQASTPNFANKISKAFTDIQQKSSNEYISLNSSAETDDLLNFSLNDSLSDSLSQTSTTYRPFTPFSIKFQSPLKLKKPNFTKRKSTNLTKLFESSEKRAGFEELDTASNDTLVDSLDNLDNHVDAGVFDADSDKTPLTTPQTSVNHKNSPKSAKTASKDPAKSQQKNAKTLRTRKRKNADNEMLISPQKNIKKITLRPRVAVANGRSRIKIKESKNDSPSVKLPFKKLRI